MERRSAFLLVGAYSASRGGNLVRICHDAEQAGGRVRLLSRDIVHPELERWTVGVVTGDVGRFEKINSLLDGEPPDEHLVVIDDDVRFTRRDVGAFVQICTRLELDLGQPSHDASSYISHPITRRVRPSVWRETRFVEIGPCLFVHRDARIHFQPFPTRTPRGWGVEALWARLASEHELTLGIVDAVAIRHLEPPGRYGEEETAREVAELMRFLTENGYDSLQDLLCQSRRALRPITLLF